MKVFKIAAVACAALFVLAMIADAEAKGRSGSKRVGGYSSHGKGSHYVGGRR